MIVVADTSPLNYLVLIGEVHLLPMLFKKLLVPEAAYAELQHPATPLTVRRWLSNMPVWLEVCTVGPVTLPALSALDPGEREAIQLALDRNIHVVLIDESKGRHVAEALNLEVRGTLGILARAAKLGRIDLRHALHKLEQTNFRMSPAVRAELLRNFSR